MMRFVFPASFAVIVALLLFDCFSLSRRREFGETLASQSITNPHAHTGACTRRDT